MAQKIGGQGRVIGKVDPPHKVSDKAARLWESYYGPMNGAAQALNAAITNTQNILGRIVLEMDGFSTDTHILDAETMTIRQRPQENGR